GQDRDQRSAQAVSVRERASAEDGDSERGEMIRMDGFEVEGGIRAHLLQGLAFGRVGRGVPSRSSEWRRIDGCGGFDAGHAGDAGEDRVEYLQAARGVLVLLERRGG